MSFRQMLFSRRNSFLRSMRVSAERFYLYRMLRLLHNSSLSVSPYITVSDFDQMIDISRLSWCQAEGCIEYTTLCLMTMTRQTNNTQTLIL